MRDGGYDVKIMDGWLNDWSHEELFKQILANKKPLFIGFSAYQSNMYLAIETLKEVKKEWPDILFVAGGFGPTFNSRDFMAEYLLTILLSKKTNQVIVFQSHLQTSDKPR